MLVHNKFDEQMLVGKIKGLNLKLELSWSLKKRKEKENDQKTNIALKDDRI